MKLCIHRLTWNNARRGNEVQRECGPVLLNLSPHNFWNQDIAQASEKIQASQFIQVDERPRIAHDTGRIRHLP